MMAVRSNYGRRFEVLPKPRICVMEHSTLKQYVSDRQGRLGRGESEMGSLQCPACSSVNVININLTMEDGESVSFYSCHTCDRKWWDRDGATIELSSVLELAKRAPRRARQKS